MPSKNELKQHIEQIQRRLDSKGISDFVRVQLERKIWSLKLELQEMEKKESHIRIQRWIPHDMKSIKFNY